MMAEQELLLKRLYTLQDATYQAFAAKLIPNLPPESIIGVRTPALRTLAKELERSGGAQTFLGALPHRYFEENQLHALLITAMRDYDRTIAALDAFLPFVDNWATCDQMSPAVFAKHRDALLREIDRWIGSGETYTQRFAIGMLQRWYLDDAFDPAYLRRVAAVESGEYYVNMMRAWYFATALARQYDAALPYLEERRLDEWTHRRTVRKALESFRIPPEHKAYLRTLAKR